MDPPVVVPAVVLSHGCIKGDLRIDSRAHEFLYVHVYVYTCIRTSLSPRLFFFAEKRKMAWTPPLTHAHKNIGIRIHVPLLSVIIIYCIQ